MATFFGNFILKTGTLWSMNVDGTALRCSGLAVSPYCKLVIRNTKCENYLSWLWYGWYSSSHFARAGTCAPKHNTIAWVQISYILFDAFRILLVHLLNHVSWFTYVRKTNKMHIFRNNLFHFELSSTCFEQVNCSSSGGVLYRHLTVFL